MYFFQRGRSTSDKLVNILICDHQSSSNQPIDCSLKSPGPNGSQWRQFCDPGSMRQCSETVWIVAIGEGAFGLSWVDARDAAKCSTLHRTAPTAENLTQNVSSAEIKRTSLDTSQAQCGPCSDVYQLSPLTGLLVILRAKKHK